MTDARWGKDGLIIPHERFIADVRKAVITYDEPEWVAALAERLGLDKDVLAKQILRCRQRGGIYLRMAEQWCDALRIHPRLLISDYYRLVHYEDECRCKADHDRVMLKRKHKNIARARRALKRTYGAHVLAWAKRQGARKAAVTRWGTA